MPIFFLLFSTLNYNFHTQLMRKRFIYFFPILGALALLILSSKKNDVLENGAFSVILSDTLFEVTYDKTLLQYPEYKFEDGFAKFYYARMEEQAYDDILFQLKDIKESLKLNDWLFYQVLDQSVDSILIDEKHRNNHTIVTSNFC